MTGLADPFRAELGRLAALFDLNKPDARIQAEAALAKRVVTIKALRWSGAHAWLRLDDRKSDRADRRADEIEAEAAAIAGLLARRSKWNPYAARDEGATPETAIKHRQRREDPILALHRKQKIDDRQREAAHDINRIFYELTRPLFSRARMIRSAGRVPKHSFRPPADMRADLDHRRRHVYRPWAIDMEARAGKRMEIVIGVAVDGHGLETMGRACHMPHDRALSRLQEALHVYAEYLEGYRRHREFIGDD